MDIYKFCESFYSSHYVPVIILKDKQIENSFCSYDKFAELFSNYENRFMNLNSFPAVINSNNLGLYGVIKANKSNKLIVIGPVYSKRPSEDEFSKFLSKSFANIKEEQKIKDFIFSIPNYNYNRFLNLLVFLEFSINDNVVSVTDIFFDEKAKEEVIKKQIVADMKYERVEHGTYFLEQEIIDYVSKGDVISLKNFF